MVRLGGTVREALTHQAKDSRIEARVILATRNGLMAGRAQGGLEGRALSC